MAIYQIVETPGKALAYPKTSEDRPLKNQDEAKVVLQRLRAEARAEGRTVDFVVQRMNDAGSVAGNGNAAASAAGTSIRLSEENRRAVARFCGRIMMETGDSLAMGDAVRMLIGHYEKTADLVDDDAIVARAKAILKRRKEEAA